MRNQSPPMTIMVNLPVLDDASAVTIYNFLCELVDRFDDHYGEQICRFYEMLTPTIPRALSPMIHRSDVTIPQPMRERNAFGWSVYGDSGSNETKVGKLVMARLSTQKENKTWARRKVSMSPDNEAVAAGTTLFKVLQKKNY